MIIDLPQPSCPDPRTLGQAIEMRKTCREFLGMPVTAEALSQLLWAAQGVTRIDGSRTAPSAGAQYPVQIYTAIGNVKETPSGFYQYQPKDHKLDLVADGDFRAMLCEAALGEQPWVNEAALILILSADFKGMQEHFYEQAPRGKRGDRYVFLESGAIAQNIHLQATVSGLGMVLVGGFDDGKVASALCLPGNLKPTAIICIGVDKSTYT